jgi:hypothetical protein
MKDREQQKAPAWEVVRDTEDRLERVSDLRRRAADLLREAARRQQQAYEYAVSELGLVNGSHAYDLACMSASIDPDLRDGADRRESGGVPAAERSAGAAAEAERPIPVKPDDVLPRTPTATPVHSPSAAPEKSAAPQPATRPAAPPTRTEPVSQFADDPTRLVLHGVEVKRSKAQEANEVVEAARSAAARGHKSNPYSGDRGRNAWRNALFVAALAAHGGDTTDPAVTMAAFSAPAPSTPEGGDAADRDEPFEDDDGTDVLDDETRASAPMTAAVEPAEAPSRPAAAPTFSRSVAYTENPVQTAPVTAAPRPAAVPPFVAQAPRPRAEDVAELHVSRPIAGRTVAHGQASPMPEGLKDVRRIEGDAQAAPVLALKPQIPRPPFLRRDQ